MQCYKFSHVTFSRVRTMVALTTLQRKAALMEKGVTQAQIAATLGISEQQVSQVMNCERTERRSRRVEQAIADAIGKPVAKVFPKATQGAA